MPTSLQRLLSQLDPDETLDPIDRRADAAINSFRVRSATIESWSRFEELMADFWLHVFCGILGARKDAEYPKDYVRGRALQVLGELYGVNGPKAAFEYARTGNEGGLYRVLKDVARHVADELARNQIATRVCSYWDGLTADEKIAASSEYLREFGRFLPSELTEEGAIRIRANFWRVLERHPALVRRMRRATRSK